MKSGEFRLLLVYTFNLILLVLAYPVILVVKLIKSLRAGRRKTEDVNGQVAVVTGSGQGLGRELAIELAKLGCHIALVDIQYDLASATARDIRERYKVKTKAYKVDVSNSQELEEFYAQVTKDFGDVTILINNAGVIQFSDSNQADFDEIQNIISANFTSLIWTNQLFLPRMKALNRGHIMAITSPRTLFPKPILEVYVPTKSAVLSYMNTLRSDFKSEKCQIKLTTVMPSSLTIGGNVVAREVVESMLQGIEEFPIPDVCSMVYQLFEYVTN